VFSTSKQHLPLSESVRIGVAFFVYFGPSIRISREKGTEQVPKLKETPVMVFSFFYLLQPKG